MMSNNELIDFSCQIGNNSTFTVFAKDITGKNKVRFGYDFLQKAALLAGCGSLNKGVNR